MSSVAKMSTKGQLVVPKGVRERHGLHAGRDVEFIERNGTVFLRAAPTEREAVPSVEDVFARLSALNTYRGPRVSDEDVRKAVEATALANDLATRGRR